jgi:NAD(P)H-dependent flavin oxidoreductase YrpB (nitropropane dioxygenase family)
MLENPKFLEIVKYLGLKHIEIVDAYQSNIDFIRQTRKENGFNIILKTTHPNAELISEVDGVILKGPEGAGTSFDEFGTIQHMVSTVGNQFPNKFVVATGGIGTAQQVKELIDLGANMVGVGTRYAVSEESSISHETKLKMIDASWNDVTKIQKSSQNALIFKTVEDMRDDENNTRSLEIGVKYGHAVHVFAGKAIDNVTAIKTVKEITEELTKDL